ncbi:DUF5658 family protein [Sulfolobaceae archaeon RB850M]
MTRNPLIISSLTLLSLVDISTTFLGLTHGLIEANPLLSSLPLNLMIPTMILLKSLLIVLAFYALKRGYWIQVLLVTGILLAVAINNITLLLLSW